jgi:hypothetical protein
MLAGIHHQQQAPVGEYLRHALGRSLAAAKLQPHRRRHRGRHQPGVGKAGELDQPNAVGRVPPQLARQREGQRRLADAAGSGQRDKPMRGREVEDFAEFLLAADQFGNRLRYVGQRQDRRGRRHRRAEGRVRARGEYADFTGELVAASDDGADQLLVGTERLAQCPNLGVKIILLDNPVRPDPRHQYVFADDGPRRLDQHQQHIQRAAAELDRPVVGK